MRHTSLVVIIAVLLVACGGPGADATPDAADPGVAPVLVVADGGAGGPGLSVGDALGHRAADDLVHVTGALFIAADGTVRLCDAIAESFPPQCGGARIDVRGLDPGEIEGLEEANGVRWAESVTLFGSVE
jgi:hypothetical protein